LGFTVVRKYTFLLTKYPGIWVIGSMSPPTLFYRNVWRVLPSMNTGK
jgi:hypothetical protein